MNKINPLALSVIGGLFIFTAVYILFWVLFLCLDSPDASQAAINTLGSYFGGVATLWAAIVAAYLFNDWKDQHNKNLEKDAIYQILSVIESHHFPLMQSVNEILEIRMGLSKGFTIFHNNIILVKNPELKERLRYSAKIIESFSNDPQVSILLEKYFEELNPLDSQTYFYAKIHNDVKKSMGLGEFEARMTGGIVSNMGMLISDGRSPVPYEKKYENYTEAFNSLTIQLIGKTRA